MDIHFTEPEEKKKAWEQTIRLLAIKGRFKEEVKKRLQLKKFSHDAIESALKRADELGFFDDQQLGRRQVKKWLEKGYGPLLIRAKLQEQGGLSPGLLNEAYEKQEETIERLLNKLKGGKAKVYAALVRRGFEREAIAKCLLE